MLENPAIVAVTGGELIILTAAMGMVAGELWLLPGRQASESSTLINTRARMWLLLGLCLMGFTAGSVLELLLRTAAMSDLPLREAHSQLDTVLSKTHYGRLWLWRGTALLVLWGSWGLNRVPALSYLAAVASFLALAVIILTLSASGHAGDDGMLTAANIANSLHITGGLLWGGGIIVASVVIFPLLLRDQLVSRALIAVISLRLSTLAGIALALVLIPGIYNAWLQIDSWHGLWATLYGRLLVAKVVLVAVMVGLGALNRYRYVPAIQRQAGLPEPRILIPLLRSLSSNNDAGSLMDFLRNLKVEVVLLLAVLSLAAALSQQTPDVHVNHQDMAGHVHGDE